MNKSELCILIVALNEENFIEESIESAISACRTICENGRSAKVVVWVSDISNDLTYDKSIQYTPAIDVILETDTSMGDAVNQFIKKNDFKYYCVIGGDDKLFAQGLLNSLNLFIQNHDKHSFVYGNIDIIDEKNNLIKVYKGRHYNETKMFFKNIVPSQSVIFRSDLFKTLGGYDALLCADWMLWIKMARLKPPRYVNRHIAQYRVHPGSTSGSQKNKMAESTKSGTKLLLKGEGLSRYVKWLGAWSLIFYQKYIV